MATFMRSRGFPGPRADNGTRRDLGSLAEPQPTQSTQPPLGTLTQGVQTQERLEILIDLVETIYNALSAVESSPAFPTNHHEELATIRNALGKIQETALPTQPPTPGGFETLLNELKEIKKDLHDTKQNVAEIQQATHTPSVSSSPRTWASVVSMLYTTRSPMSIPSTLSTSPIPSVTLKVTDTNLSVELKALNPPRTPQDPERTRLQRSDRSQDPPQRRPQDYTTQPGR